MPRTEASGTPLFDGWNGFIPPNTAAATYLGNRSYTVVIPSTDVTGLVGPGTRLRFDRGATTQTQVTSLNGSTQFYNKTSPNKLTFTNNFVCSAWIKVTSYASAFIISRYNGTSGWGFYLNSSGQILMSGFNAGSSNNSNVTSTQSVPLNRWVHVAAELDMASFTVSSTTSYVMIDGVNVPATVSRGGTNPTALVQAGNLEVGGGNGGASPFPGKLAQVAVFSAKVTQATIQSYISQGLQGIETSLASAYSFNNAITDLNTTTPNDLTAQGSAVATNSDSPFGVRASGTVASTNYQDYGIITAATFSSDTTLTVQCPIGGAIPSSGSVAPYLPTAIAYSVAKAPHQFPTARSLWIVDQITKVNLTQSSPVAGTWYNLSATSGVTGGNQITIPLGSWMVSYQTEEAGVSASNNNLSTYSTLSTGASTETDSRFTAVAFGGTTAGGTDTLETFMYRLAPLDLASATIYFLNAKTATSLVTILSQDGSVGQGYILAECGLL